MNDAPVRTFLPEHAPAAEPAPPPAVVAVEHLVLCPDCTTPMKLRPPGKYGGPWYGCPHFPDCKGSHGAHPDGRPLGVPATAAVKALRVAVHAAFDLLWKDAVRYDTVPKPRELAYRWLAMALGLDPAQCHIGGFDAETCTRALAALAGMPVDVWRAHYTEWSELPSEPDTRIKAPAL